MTSPVDSERTYSIDMFTLPKSKQSNEPIEWTRDELEALESGKKKRKDGRGLQEFRPICINADSSMNADGSAYAELGNTKVYCVVNAPHEISVKDSMAEASVRGVLMVKVTYAPFASKTHVKRQRPDQETVEERAYADAITDAFTPLILLDKYPRTQIDLLITVIEDDGGVLPLALTACSVALTNAQIEIHDVIVAGSLFALDDHFLLDPTSDERARPTCSLESSSPSNKLVENARITLALMPSLNQVVCVSQEGQLKPKNFSKALKLLTISCYQQFPVIKEAIGKSIRRERSK